MMNYDHEDYNNASINAFVFKHVVNIKRAYARTSWATGFMSLCRRRTVSQMGFGGFSQGAKCGHYRYLRKKRFMLQTFHLV